MNFLILGLPRSRTYWAAHFLRSAKRHVEHNRFVRCRTLDEIVAYFDAPNVGASDPAAGAIWRQLLPRIPHVKVALIRRPVAAVLASLRELGSTEPFLPELLQRYDAELDALEASGLARTFQFSLLGMQSEAAGLFQRCTGEPLDLFWWQMMRHQNLQSPEIGDPLAAKEACLDGPVARAVAGFVKREMEDAT